MDLKNLRNATERHHQKVEAELDWLRPSLTLADYVALLGRFYGFHQTWEPRVASLLALELPDFFPPRRKLQNLEADLRHLGCRPEDLLGFAPCHCLPTLSTVGSALGSLYVIEGSTLGGQILSRHFSEHLGMRRDAGCQYFSAYRERTGQMWKAFGGLLASRPPAEDDDMVKAAAATFESVRAWLGDAHA